MGDRFTTGLSGVALVLAAGCAAAQTPPAGQSSENVEVVHVAPPTGDRETDRASIHAAVEQVEPGGTIQFAPGTYLIGAGIRIEVARLTLRGHPQGTTLRGCDPDEFATYGIVAEVVENCGGLRLLAGHQSVHDLTFEYASTGLYLGLGWEPGEAHRTEGGDRIMNNTVRMTGHGIFLDGDWPEPSVIRNNRFINSYHALVIFGGTAHVLDNRFSVPEPERVPIAGFPDEAVRIHPRARKAGDTLPAVCGRNVVAGNRIEGTLIGIEIRVREADTRCEGNVIRDNWIAVTPARVPEWSDYGAPDDSRIVYGVALALNDLAAEGSGTESDAAASRISGNVIEGNRIIGGSGPAIQLYGAAGNQIVDNTITGVRLRETYPGHTQFLPPPGTDANGSGIWISRGSDDNEIVGNTFEDIASYALVIEGDSNHVEVRTDADAVRDLGTGNRVDAPGTTTRHPEHGEVAYESSFVQVRGIRMHYLDFGGSGLPVIFIHGSHANARSFVDFAPRFADAFRVFAPDRRSHGESENVDWGHGTAAQAEDILGFMDALGLERAVLIGNDVGLTTYLGEHHPDRLAGIIFLRHMAPEVESRRDSSAVVFWDMASRTACDWDEKTRQRNTQRDGYRPHFIDDPDFRIDVPALSLANADGTRYPADFDFVGFFLQQVETGEWCDTTAKAYFSTLAADTARATELRNRLGDLTGAAILPAFERAFGPRMTVVRLGVPAVSSYEYLGAPDLIYPHIRTFLEGLAGGDP